MKASIPEAVLSHLADRIAPRIVDKLAILYRAEIERHVREYIMPELSARMLELSNEICRTSVAEKVATEIDARLEAASSRASERLADLSQAVVTDIKQQLPDWILQIADAAFISKMQPAALTKSNLFVPNHLFAATGDPRGEYMRASNPVARDFLHPEFKAFCDLAHYEVQLQRKYWEWAYIYRQLQRGGVLRAGKRGLGFGTGQERLPSIFAASGAHVTATDAAASEGGWFEGSDEQKREALYHGGIIGRDDFRERVAYRACDMNDIPSDLVGFDFLWSSCALEHLGSLQNGIDFVVSSLEKTLKVGGIACHTTELNLSSNSDTLEHPTTVLYRKQDIERLCATLTQRGHLVEPLRIDPGDLPPDYFVDIPPYWGSPHLKLVVGGFVTTSIGIVVRRGR